MRWAAGWILANTVAAAVLTVAFIIWQTCTGVIRTLAERPAVTARWRRVFLRIVNIRRQQVLHYLLGEALAAYGGHFRSRLSLVYKKRT